MVGNTAQDAVPNNIEIVQHKVKIWTFLHYSSGHGGGHTGGNNVGLTEMIMPVIHRNYILSLIARISLQGGLQGNVDSLPDTV